MRPLAGLSFGGTSPPPVKVAWMGILRARACEPAAINAPQAKAITPGSLFVLPFRNQHAVADMLSPVSRLFLLRLGRGSRGAGASKRQPGIGEDRVVARGVMRAAEKRAVEIVRAAVEMQILGELNADARIPGRVAVGTRRAVSERDIGEVEDQPVALGAGSEAVLERAQAV